MGSRAPCASVQELRCRPSHPASPRAGLLSPDREFDGPISFVFQSLNGQDAVNIGHSAYIQFVVPLPKSIFRYHVPRRFI